MKKLISIFIVSLLFVGLAWAQGTVTFDEPGWNLLSNNQYGDGNTTINGVVWEYGHSRDEGDYPINGAGLMLRRPSDSYLQAEIPGGIGNFSIDYRKAFTGGATRKLELIINGVTEALTDNFGSDDGITHTLTHEVNTEGNVLLKIKIQGTATGNAQTTIDNISWTAHGSGPIDPLLTVTPLNLSGFFYTEATGPSNVQSFTVGGSYLNGNILLVVD
ncbi:MAG: hypothetical protein GX106_03490, partial [Candidatus Cloacimonetes bacterium]|nr:hypothetical protein [Candidatus Cloacimonadota bacterium]